ncbi:antibiotic biosynthesis monooxygenase [Streptomyces sp. NPDC058653]|uniref:globin domain-containing protein n=1 Tax=Streptomyces sp. NPDC058653 TaxID=3346576 RepID=UPI0036460981
MILEYIRYRIPENGTEEFEAAYARAAGPLGRSPFCHDFELSRCVEEPDHYILRIHWESVEKHLQDFRSSEEFRAFFAEIRPYVDAIEEMRHYSLTDVVGIGAGTPQPPTLYEWAGGNEAFERLFGRFYEKVRADELLSPLFAGMSENHPHHVALWIGEVFGGPAEYTAHHGGYENMLAHHIDRAISPAQRRRWVDLLVDAADETGLPADPDFRAAFMSYIEWGTRVAMENSQPDASPVRSAPVPRWGWGVAPPYQP